MALLDARRLAQRHPGGRARGLQCRPECGDHRRAETQGQPHRQRARGEVEARHLLDQVERGERAAHLVERDVRDQHAERAPGHGAERAEHAALQDEHAHDAGAREAQCAQHSNVAPLAHDRERDRVQHQEHADEDGDERQRGEVQPERAHHVLDLARARLRALGAGIGGKLGRERGTHALARAPARR
jgi:hypothetical protein